MSALEQRVAEYLAIRRALGYKLVGYDAILRDLTIWLDAQGAEVLTADLALAWAQSRPTSSAYRQRLWAIRDSRVLRSTEFAVICLAEPSAGIEVDRLL